MGYLNSERDFGYAPDFMKAAWLMMQDTEPRDYVIGTGIGTRLNDFVRIAYEKAGLNYEDYLIIEDKLPRSDGLSLKANITRIKTNLHWQPEHTVEQIIEKMLEQ